MTTVSPDRRAPLLRPRAYSVGMQLLHWLTLPVLAGTYALAWSVDGAASHDAAKLLIMLHRSFGFTVGAITAARLLFRQVVSVPKLPSDVPALQRLAAKSTTIALYALLLIQPLLGITASLLHGDRVSLFGFGALPLLLQQNRALSRQIFALHGAAALAILALVSVHAAAACYHHFIRRDDVLLGMLPTMARGRSKTATQDSCKMQAS